MPFADNPYTAAGLIVLTLKTGKMSNYLASRVSAARTKWEVAHNLIPLNLLGFMTGGWSNWLISMAQIALLTTASSEHASLPGNPHCSCIAEERCDLSCTEDPALQGSCDLLFCYFQLQLVSRLKG